MKNKKLVKQVAVASLAALMTIPNLATDSYALTLDEAKADGKFTLQEAKELGMDMDTAIENGLEGYTTTSKSSGSPSQSHQRNIKHAQEMIEKFKKEGNAEGVKNWTKNLEKLQSQELAKSVEEAEKVIQNARSERAQHEAERQALAVEKDRIANTVYPLIARYVKDFVPAVDDGQPHFYERPDLPGVIFTIQKTSLGVIIDKNPNVKIEIMKDVIRESHPNDRLDLSYDDTYQQIKLTYISPFNYAGGNVAILDFNVNADQNGWAGARCYCLGENEPVLMDRLVDLRYKSGWPDYYIGKNVNEIDETNCDPKYGYYPKSDFKRYSLEELYAVKKFVTFTDQEKVKRSGMTAAVNSALGVDWIYEQDIYSVAREHGTDYTEAERQIIASQPKPVKMEEEGITHYIEDWYDEEYEKANDPNEYRKGIGAITEWDFNTNEFITSVNMNQ